jgi:hypothetical protein
MTGLTSRAPASTHGQYSEFWGAAFGGRYIRGKAMSDTFFITNRKYREHKTLESARHELARVRALEPGRQFSLLCVTRMSDPKARSFAVEKEFAGSLQRPLLTEKRNVITMRIAPAAGIAAA